jgi:hypothetical protein
MCADFEILEANNAIATIFSTNIRKTSLLAHHMLKEWLSAPHSAIERMDVRHLV